MGERQGNLGTGFEGVEGIYAKTDDRLRDGAGEGGAESVRSGKRNGGWGQEDCARGAAGKAEVNCGETLRGSTALQLSRRDWGLGWGSARGGSESLS